MASRAAVRIKNTGAWRDGLSSREESSAPLRSSASSALKLFSCRKPCLAAVKAVQLRQLGFTPTTGVTINLIYSGCAFLLFAWIIIRWYRCRRT